MNRTLTFEIPEEIYTVLEERAEREGRSTEAVVLEYLARHAPKPRPKLREEELRAAHEELMSFAGAASLGYATGADNESIDRDLAEEYGSSHEDAP
ncbi:MAG TPA: hypothetical protein VG148_12520 [Pyrinomonadaceae bacterium]|nr:hypothetical protein [Pyrinomonadaceae bacterium]